MLVTLRTESGDLAEGYRIARGLVDQRPDSAESHFALGYVLRYAGLLSEAARECELARQIDPAGAGQRSCAIVFLMAGDTRRARDFTSLDEGTHWSTMMNAFILRREGRLADGIALARSRNLNSVFWPLMKACSEKRAGAEIRRVAADMQKELEIVGDAENFYWGAVVLADCGQRPEALKVLRRSVTNYCAYPALDKEPSFASLRDDPEFARIRETAMECQKRFLAAR
jgi:hypothetical protein